MNRFLLTLAVALGLSSPPVSGQSLTESAGGPHRGAAPVHSLRASAIAGMAAGNVMPQPRSAVSSGGLASVPVIKNAVRQVTSSDVSVPELYGCVVYADGWDDAELHRGMYRIGTSESEPFTRLGTSKVNATSGGVAIGDSYYACYFVNLYGTDWTYVQKFDTTTWEEDYKNWDFFSEATLISTGVVYDKATGRVYGCFRNDTNTGYVFGYADYAAKQRTSIRSLSRMWSAVSIDRKGQIYAIDELGDLYSVDKTDGAMTFIGKTGLVATHPSSACIDPRSGRMFYALTADPDGLLYEIDLATAVPTLICHFPQNQEIVGMYAPVPDADDDAPDAVTGLQLGFSNGSLSGTVSFTCPAVTFGGTRGEGTISYVVTANGATVASGAAAYGERVDAGVTLPKAGEYTFEVYASNVFGDGPKTRKTIFAGHDIPATPQLSASMTGGVVTISWEPVTGSVNGGYVDLADLTYKVTRLPDGKVLAEATRETVITDTPPGGSTLTGYSYSVAAHAGQVQSEAAVTPVFWLGAVNPPYSITFDSADNAAPYSVIDANGDKSTWFWSEADNAFRSQSGLFGSVDADDWLVTPAVRLEKGKMYQFTARMHGYFGNPARAEIRFGKAATAAGMNETVLEPTRITSRTSEDYTGYLIPDEDGEYFVGIHAVTPASDGWPLYVDGVSVTAGVVAVIPDVVTDFVVTPDAAGAKKAEITLKAPVKAVNGSQLDAILRLDILRDGAKVHSFANPAPGAALSFTDEVAAGGYYRYEALAYNASGAGKKLSQTVYVGANEPARPQWLGIAESSPGKVTLFWPAVTTDKDGKPLNPDLVTYTIITADDNGEAVTVAENIRELTYTLEVPGAAVEQTWAYYALRAVTEGGYSLRADSPVIPVGKSYPVPYAESFGNGFAASLIRSENGAAAWSIYDDASGIPSYENDNGYAAMFGEVAGSDATLYSGKVSLGNVVNPVLSFYAYNIVGADADANEIEVSISTGAQFKVVKTVRMSELGDADGWYLVQVPLADYSGKDVQFGLRGITRTRKFTLVDNIRIVDAKAHNLSVASVSAPSKVKPDEAFSVAVAVENNGTEDASAYTVTLFRNGVAVATETPAALASGATARFNFAQTLNVSHDEKNEYHAVVDYASDLDQADNASGRCQVTLQLTAHPTVSGLRGEERTGGVVLEWVAPDLASAASNPVTDDFEDYASWEQKNIGNWTLVDADNVGVGHIGNVELPGIYNSRLAYFVMDASLPGLDSSLAAYSGDKYLSTMFCLPSESGSLVANDDWLISPKLTGEAQTVSFMARSANVAEVAESFELWYATSDSTDPKDFTMLKAETSVPGDWTEYSFSLPDGASRFAIRYNHTYGLMLHIDDITYTPAGDHTLTVEGYNVYRNGERINQAPVKDTAYTDSWIPVGATSWSYAVSVVYGVDGESRACDPVEVRTSGVGQVAADASVSVTGGRNGIVITGAGGMNVAVNDVSGRVVLAGRGSESMHVAVPAGVYVVAVGNATFKVAVR